MQKYEKNVGCNYSMLLEIFYYAFRLIAVA